MGLPVALVADQSGTFRTFTCLLFGTGVDYNCTFGVGTPL